MSEENAYDVNLFANEYEEITGVKLGYTINRGDFFHIMTIQDIIEYQEKREIHRERLAITISDIIERELKNIDDFVTQFREKYPEYWKHEEGEE